jgi:two-component system, chemotaxis family, CheB/CheR fusion protein
VVGASAGGLEAFRRFLGALPAQSGMAFILIPHLDPTRESRMVELLAASSAMPVAPAADGQRIRPNHVYVIPPNCLLAVRAGCLALTPLPHPRTARTALDFALRSLAEDRGANAVGIVLSGTGSHGSSGLKEVLGAGGLALAQDPATAQYEQMPRNAAAVGVSPRHILAPESMAPVLLARARELAQGGPRAVASSSTLLFRDPEGLDALASEALPSLAARATAALPARVWIPDCGSGEEAYSVAMLLLERLEAAGKHGALKVFATDPNADSLRVARHGIYPKSIARTLSHERLTRFFNPLPTGQYLVSSELRETLVFGQLELFCDPPISKLDLLVCRAPLANAPPDACARLMSRLYFALHPGGYLLLGPGAPVTPGLFEPISAHAALYRKNGLASGPRGRAHAVAGRAGGPESRHVSRRTRLESAAEFMNHALLEKLAPAAILMDARYRILATRGPVIRYLRIAPRMPLPSLLTAAGASLLATTRSACEEAVRNHRWARHGCSWKGRDGRHLRCSVSARSLRSRASGEPLLLVIFEEVESGHRNPHGSITSVARKIVSDRGVDRPDEAWPGNLQAILADLEHARDDLEVSTEQMTSMNEELRTANEELQSANEEMRAMNEELESSRSTLEERTAAAERAEAQLRAVLDATADAVVTINPDGRIVTFNGTASRVFGYALHEVIGCKVNMLMPPELRSLHDEQLARYRATHQRHVMGTSREVLAYRRDGTSFPALLSVSETAGTNLIVGCLRDLTADKALQEEVLNIAALEQQRIGQELHDGTQQELTGLGLLAQNLSEELQKSHSANADLAGRVAAGIADANRQVRALARGLVPAPVGADTLPAALGELARNTQETYKLSCRLDCPTPLDMPDAATATHLYRIAQEAVGNAAKHSRARDVLISLTRDDDRLRLEIHDNGIGIPAQPAASGGVGLRLMEHRCAAIGGRFMIGPRAGGGTIVSCSVPFPARA